MSVAKVLDLIVAKGVEYTLVGEPTNAKEYAEAITWHSAGSAPSWSEIEAGFIAVDNQATDKSAAKAALLERLGITAEEATLLLG
jgi:hypothetical protein